MDKVLTVLVYKLKILFSDKGFLITMTVIPLLLTFITGYALIFEKYSEVPVAICDMDGTDYSGMIVEGIKNSKGFKVYVTGEKEAIKLVKDYKAECAFIIREGFKDNIISGNVQGIIEQVAPPSSMSREIIKEIVGGTVARILLNVYAADWVVNEYANLDLLFRDDVEKREQVWNEAWQFTDSLWEPEPPMKLEFREIREETPRAVETGDGGSLAGSISSSAFGMLVAFLMFLIMFNSSWLVDEKENGTLQRVISGPGALNALFSGNIISLFIVGIVQVFLFASVSWLIFRADVFLNPFNIVILFLYLLCVIGISIFLSTLLKTRLQLQAGAPLFAIITGFLGGCFWNFPGLGGVVKTLSLFTPQGLALDLFSRYGLQASSKTAPTADLIQEILAMLASTPSTVLLAIAFITISLSYVYIKKLKY